MTEGWNCSASLCSQVLTCLNDSDFFRLNVILWTNCSKDSCCAFDARGLLLATLSSYWTFIFSIISLTTLTHASKDKFTLAVALPNLNWRTDLPYWLQHEGFEIQLEYETLVFQKLLVMLNNSQWPGHKQWKLFYRTCIHVYRSFTYCKGSFWYSKVKGPLCDSVLVNCLLLADWWI